MSRVFAVALPRALACLQLWAPPSPTAHTYRHICRAATASHAHECERKIVLTLHTYEHDTCACRRFAQWATGIGQTPFTAPHPPRIWQAMSSCGDTHKKSAPTHRTPIETQRSGIMRTTFDALLIYRLEFPGKIEIANRGDGGGGGGILYAPARRRTTHATTMQNVIIFNGKACGE